MSARRVLLALVVAALFSSGCGRDEPADAGPTSSDSPSQASPSSTPSATRPPYEVIKGPLGRCGPQPVAASEAGYKYLKLRDPAVGTLPAVRAGKGRTVVVLLHQTDGNGFCGWLDFGSTLAADPRLSVLAFDTCGYAEARCQGDPDQVAPVRVAVRYARQVMHARRVVVMGASMGGSVALMAASRVPGIATAVDLSGPMTWDGMETIRQGRALRVKVLVAVADSEGEDEVRGARRIVDNAPEGSEFVPAESGHGYELLVDREGRRTPIAERVVRWLEAS